MRRRSGQFWFNAALIGAAAVLPFGTLVLVAAGIVRARSGRAPRAVNPYDDWWELRALADGSDGSYSRYAHAARSAVDPCVCRFRRDRRPAQTR